MSRYEYINLYLYRYHFCRLLPQIKDSVLKYKKNIFILCPGLLHKLLRLNELRNVKTVIVG